MDNWTIRQEIDLQRGAEDAPVWPCALMMQGDTMAHTWRVTVKSGGTAHALTGIVTGYFERGDGNTVPVTGIIAGNVASVTLPQACYTVPGPLLGVLRLKQGQTTMTLAVLHFCIGAGTSSSYVDAEHIIPSLDDLLAKIADLEAATVAAKTATTAATAATGAANTAAGTAHTAATAASAAASGANAAAAAASAATAKWDTVSVDVDMLPPDGAAGGSVTQGDHSTTIHLDLPQGRVTNATLYMDDATMTVMQRMPTLPQVGIDWAIDERTTMLYQRVHGY